MKELLIIRPLYFYFLFIPFLAAGLIVIAGTDKSSLFLWSNQYHSRLADVIFTWLTWVGNGAFFLVLVVLVFFRNMGNGILGATVFIVSSLLPQLLKNFSFPHALRPIRFFEGKQVIYLVEGVKQHAYHSFPSGHAATAVAMAIFLTLIVKDRRWGLLFAALALLVAFSRVYLAQHFFEDIYAGSCIGCLSTLLVFAFMEKWVRQKKKLQRRLI